MDKRQLQTYSVWAKDNLEKQIEVSLKTLGVNGDKDIKKARLAGDYTVIDGDSNSYPAELLNKRNQLVALVGEKGYKNVIEEFAYTWFNRFVALRFMEVHDFLPHGFRVLSNRSGSVEPEILKNLELVKDELKLDMPYCAALKGQGKTEELYRYVLIRQCNALADILPMLFVKENDYLELLLPKSLLIGETVITRLLDIPAEAFLKDVEIIGWLYQFYISVKKDQVNAAKKTITKETLPAVTQLFTPDWIVRYMAENSVGRIWLESYPQSPLRAEMKYYVQDAEQTEDVQRQLDAIKYKNVAPEDLRVIEPCCGSGHIMVYVFDLLFNMYTEKGYSKRDIPTLILKKNLVGLDVDKRAAQLAAFSLVMKARSLNPRFFSESYYTAPQVHELRDSHYLESLAYKQRMKEMGVFTDAELKAVASLVDTFRNGKTIGSLIKVKAMDFAAVESAIAKLERDVVSTVFNIEFISEGTELLKKLLAQAKALAGKYDVMITNPPYIGTSSMEPAVKDYAVKNYPNSKTDMFAMFMETGFVKKNGLIAMINMHSWMFLSSYEKLRLAMLASREIITMAHLGARAFEEIGGEVVQTTSFVMQNSHISGYKGVYCRLVEPTTQQCKEDMFLAGESRYKSTQDNFPKIPGSPFAYWVSTATLSTFINGVPVSTISKGRSGQNTGDNSRFLRLWHEVNIKDIGFSLPNNYDGMCYQWIPYNKGGEYRRWYGNYEYVINWKYDGKEIKDYAVKRNNGKHWSRYIQNLDYLYKEGITWSIITSGTFSMRYLPKGFICDYAGCSIFPQHKSNYYLLALFNTKFAGIVLKMINPTINFQPGNIGSIPYIHSANYENRINVLVSENLSKSKTDWDSFETSWDFQRHPFIDIVSAGIEDDNGKWIKVTPLKNCFVAWKGICADRFNTLKTNEEELNRIFIGIYGLQDELTPDVEDKDVTVRLADKERDIKSLISYLVGVIMGRYSLDVPGLAYAGGAWDATKYRSYQPDDDGIVPIYSGVGMEDGLTAQIIKLIKLIYGEDTYRQNMDFIAEALDKGNNESSKETLNRYLNDGFYANHLKIYQKRPIYWLFSSGKNSGFKCLIYMHRYTEDTLARINGKYFLPESTRLKNEMDELLTRISGAEGRERVRLEKERQKLAAAYNEAIEYGQVLDHMANKYIPIDLDDGVKVNYAKFQDVELVSDNGTKIKKDLLFPIK